MAVEKFLKPSNKFSKIKGSCLTSFKKQIERPNVKGPDTNIPIIAPKAGM